MRFCVGFSPRAGNETHNAKKYDRHIKNKDLATDSKDMDKSLAQTSNEHVSAFFYLQQVIMLPKANQPCAYYSRELNNYNLIVFLFTPWDKVMLIASRGACEIASCVFSFFKHCSKRKSKLAQHITVLAKIEI